MAMRPRFRIVWLALCLPPFAWAQLPPPELTGTLLECDANVARGELAVRAPDYEVFRFQFDPQTHVERDGFSGGANRLASGDQVEVESQAVEDRWCAMPPACAC